MKGYVLAVSAAEDLDSILDYVAKESGRSRAVDVLDEFFNVFESLAAMPGMGFRRRHLTGDEVRWWPVFKYLILYRDLEQPIEILRVVHGSRDLDQILRGHT